MMGQHNNNIMHIQLKRDISRSVNRINRLRRSFLHSHKDPESLLSQEYNYVDKLIKQYLEITV